MDNKKIFKELFSSKLFTSYLICFVLVFMFFIYEPILLFISNSEDFWFTFGMMFKINIIVFFVLFLVMCFLSIFVYFISKKFDRGNIYNIYIILLSSSLIYFYLQGNYFSSKLPILDGSPINWGNFKIESIVSIIIIILVLTLNIILYKIKNEIYSKVISYLSIIIFVLLSIGLFPVIINNKKAIDRSIKCTSTWENINTLSSNKNFVILLIDMIDSRSFDEVLKEMKKEDLFKDFTYYPDTLSAYSYTRESIPFIISGKWYVLDEEYSDYYNDAFDNSSLLKRLKDEKYDINIYEQNIQWTSKNCSEVSNMSTDAFKINMFKFAKQETKYLIFKYFPYPLKKFSKISSMNFDLLKENVFDSDNKSTYNSLSDIKLQDRNYFQFLHIDGGHYPWNSDENFNIIENGTYSDKIKASINVVDKYINRIKKSGQYDDTIIIIMADHGTNGYEPIGRQNPILYIKGFNEHHDGMNVSSKKVSHIDLTDSIYDDLLDGKSSEELLKNIEDNRTRRHIWYQGVSYDKYYEQTTVGHAWETDELRNTGKVYERK